MENGNSPNDPPRLVDAPDGLGQLLRAADEDFSKGLNEPKAFRALERRRDRSVRVRRAVITASAVGALVAMAVRITTPEEPRPTSVLVTPEVFPSRTTPVATREESRAPQLTPALVTRAEQPAASAELGEPLPERRGRVKAAARPVVAPAEATATEATCGPSGSGTGHSKEAQLTCLEVVARGSGLAAEAALFEVARLSAKAQPGRALTALADHRSRFPEGALRGEVAELRIRLLYDLRRDQEALTESEQALGTTWGRVLSSKLHLLRGKIYDERLNDCARAVTEYVGLVGESGGDGDEAEFRRAACLERLGRTDEALTAYETYLRRVDPRRRATARERLLALGRSVD